MTERSRAVPSSGQADVLLTGVTGFLGQELLCQLLTDTAARVTCLIRASNDAKAERRLRETVERLFGAESWALVSSRVVAARGDVTERGMGMSRRTRAGLVRSTTHLIHCAATVRFDLPLAAARRINVGGTMEVGDFTARAHREGRLEGAVFVSTSFVGGRHPELFGEDDLDVGQEFRNTYEQSKFEAELVIRPLMRDVPVIVVRPSIVIGHSRSGATNAFNVIYWPLRIYADRSLGVAPAQADLPVDIVPVDFVARSTIAALFEGEPGTTYALAAGEHATRAGTIGDVAARVFDVRPPVFITRSLERAVVPILWPLTFIGPWRRVGRSLRQFLPYFRYGSRFDTRNADALLRPRGIEPPPSTELLEPALVFARSTDFGRDTDAVQRSADRLARQRRRALTRSAPRQRAIRRAPRPAPSGTARPRGRARAPTR